LYADRDKATPRLMWEHGVEEFDRALGSPAFRQAYLDGAPGDRVEAFRGSLRTFWAKRPVANAKDARALLRQLIAAAQDTLPVRVNGRTADLGAPGALAEALRTPMGGSHEIEAIPADSDSEMPRESRLPLVVPTVYGAAMVPDRDGIGYVRIGAFAPTTPGELDAAVTHVK